MLYKNKKIVCTNFITKKICFCNDDILRIHMFCRYSIYISMVHVYRNKFLNMIKRVVTIGEFYEWASKKASNFAM